MLRVFALSRFNKDRCMILGEAPVLNHLNWVRVEVGFLWLFLCRKPCLSHPSVSPPKKGGN